MQQIQIKDESLPQRCEVCHQSDLFDSTTNYCSRCKASAALVDSQADANKIKGKITINVTMLSSDYVHAIRSHNLQNKILLIAMLSPAIVFVYVVMSLLNQDSETNLSGLLILMLPLVVFITLMGSAILFGGHLAYRKLQDFQKDIRYTFSDSGYEISYSKGFSQADWDNLVKVRETSQCFLLYPQKLMFQIVPKRGFSNIHEIRAVRSLISSKLGKKAKLRVD